MTIFFILSSNCPRYFVPAKIRLKSKLSSFRSNNLSGTFPSAIRFANPSAIAVFPTPASPTNTGLFFVRRLRILIVLSNSFSLPIKGSSLSFLAFSTRSTLKVGKSFFFFFVLWAGIKIPVSESIWFMFGGLIICSLRLFPIGFSLIWLAWSNRSLISSLTSFGLISNSFRSL